VIYELILVQERRDLALSSLFPPSRVRARQILSDSPCTDPSAAFPSCKRMKATMACFLNKKKKSFEFLELVD
jgi:hypothetical protein